MKTILALCAVILGIGGFFVWRAVKMPDEFGKFTNAPEVSVNDLLVRPKNFLGRTVSVRGAVREQCQAMGCYFFFAARSGKLRVDLQDIAMNAPRHEGGPARVEGQLVPYERGYQLYASAVAFE
jgi:hypothetical protein